MAQKMNGQLQTWTTNGHDIVLLVLTYQRTRVKTTAHCPSLCLSSFQNSLMNSSTLRIRCRIIYAGYWSIHRKPMCSSPEAPSMRTVIIAWLVSALHPLHFYSRPPPSAVLAQMGDTEPISPDQDITQLDDTMLLPHNSEWLYSHGNNKQCCINLDRLRRIENCIVFVFVRS